MEKREILGRFVIILKLSICNFAQSDAPIVVLQIWEDKLLGDHKAIMETKDGLVQYMAWISKARGLWSHEVRRIWIIEDDIDHQTSTMIVYKAYMTRLEEIEGRVSQTNQPASHERNLRLYHIDMSDLVYTSGETDAHIIRIRGERSSSFTSATTTMIAYHSYADIRPS